MVAGTRNVDLLGVPRAMAKVLIPQRRSGCRYYVPWRRCLIIRYKRSFDAV